VISPRIISRIIGERTCPVRRKANGARGTMIDVPLKRTIIIAALHYMVNHSPPEVNVVGSVYGRPIYSNQANDAATESNI